ncbi:Bug family tripartite tricarboxylate transporter substrate binding protein [Variovorax saccharolyticus]|uniref:Bug family tripartite tricarboxylate transporter substrate binding protein n=1 Tax=Variovorax saccharolyticus TaxID=3053516 RepID=UPI002577E964|nr:tripartite tricarboxylate transporter substrate-binding protein [Variovorax sp. J22R187]MDM0019394.1 tripartite tricarboxylate transporter substrate-binding protein [Variovorax sp. J22R187]
MSTLEPTRRQALRALPAVLLAGAGTAAGAADDPSLAAAECVIPAKAGGGFDLTCALARDGLQVVRPSRPPLGQRFLPGGIGAVAFDRIATGRMGGPAILVAFSSGSLLNIAQGRFGPHSPSAARWIAALGTDYGVIAVHRDSPYRSLQDLMAVVRQEPSKVVFGAGGTVGSQDWVKAALLLRAAGRDHKSMRFVSFEGGGDALSALQGKHVDVFPGDAAEALQAIAGGAAVRILAVLSDAALGGGLAGIPTARAQKVDLAWPTVRGVYMSADVAEAAARGWIDAFAEAMAAPGYPALRERHRLYPFSLTGAALEDHVMASLARYKDVAADLGLRRWGR